jgi:hypothetical protein
MTGFTKILDVQVKIRGISLDGAVVIGQGQSSTVYRFGQEIIVKLYNKLVPLEKIQQEVKYAKKAFVAGIPTAISFDLVTCDGAYGAVFEMVDHADTVGHTLTAHPEQFDEVMRKFVDTYPEPVGVLRVELSCALDLCAEVLYRETGHRFQPVSVLHPCRCATEQGRQLHLLFPCNADDDACV